MAKQYLTGYEHIPNRTKDTPTFGFTVHYIVGGKKAVQKVFYVYGNRDPQVLRILYEIARDKGKGVEAREYSLGRSYSKDVFAWCKPNEPAHLMESHIRY